MPLTSAQLEREHRALSRHLHLMSGLLLLLEFRTTEYDSIKSDLRSAGNDKQTQMAESLELLKDKYIPSNKKARMYLDTLRQSSIYLTGPLELYFCLANSMIYRINGIQKVDPSLRHSELERFIMQNAKALEAVKDLRDWILHPDIAHRTESAVLRIQETEGKSNPVLPYETAARLFQLLKEFVEIIHEARKRN